MKSGTTPFGCPARNERSRTDVPRGTDEPSHGPRDRRSPDLHRDDPHDPSPTGTGKNLIDEMVPGLLTPHLLHSAVVQVEHGIGTSGQAKKRTHTRRYSPGRGPKRGAS